MKARHIIKRNACLAASELQKGFVYRCEKFASQKLQEGNFWHGAIVWLWQENTVLENIGSFRKGAIAAIVNGCLYPNVKFDKHFHFQELQAQKQTIVAVSCKNKACHFVKEI